jgi:hypothetical protein
MTSRTASLLVLAAALAACEGDRAAPTAPAGPASAAAASAAQDRLLTLVPAPALSAEQAARLARVRARASAAAVRVARLHGSPESILHAGRAVSIQLAPGREIVATGLRVDARGARDLSWAGRIDRDPDAAELVLTALGVTANVWTGGTLYHVEPIGDGLHAVVEMGAFPPEHPNASGVVVEPTGTPPASPPPPPSPLGAPISLPATTASAGLPTRVDVVVAYTQSVAANVYDIGGLVQLAVDESNTSYLNSGISLRLRAVYTGQVSYSEAGRSYTQHVNALQSSSDGIMDVVHSWRNGYKADVVVLLLNDPANCGQAYTINADANGAFATVHYTCATGRYSFAHEIGHLQGARHDVLVDPGYAPYQYGHGYVDPNNNWRTIMAYADGCGGVCPRVQYWSNPDVYYPPTGQAMGQSTWANNARVLNETRFRVANFRSTLVPTLGGPQYQVGHSSTCNWSVSVGGGTPPYSYGWSSSASGSNVGLYVISGQGTANVQTYSYNYNSYSISARISVSGSDAEGESYYLERTVQVSPYSPGCY